MTRSQQSDRERIARDIEEYLQRGGVIEVLPQHATSGKQLDDFTSRIAQVDKVPPRSALDLRTWRERGD